MHGIGTHRDAALALKQRLQVADAPDRHGQVIRLRSPLERRFQKRPVGIAQGVRASATRTIHEPRAAFGSKALLPDVDAIGRGMQQARRTRLGVAFCHQQERLRASPDAGVRIRLRQAM